MENFSTSSATPESILVSLYSLKSTLPPTLARRDDLYTRSKDQDNVSRLLESICTICVSKPKSDTIAVALETVGVTKVINLYVAGASEFDGPSMECHLVKVWSHLRQIYARNQTISTSGALDRGLKDMEMARLRVALLFDVYAFCWAKFSAVYRKYATALLDAFAFLSSREGCVGAFRTTSEYGMVLQTKLLLEELQPVANMDFPLDICQFHVAVNLALERLTPFLAKSHDKVKENDTFERFESILKEKTTLKYVPLRRCLLKMFSLTRSINNLVVFAIDVSRRSKRKAWFDYDLHVIFVPRQTPPPYTAALYDQYLLEYCQAYAVPPRTSTEPRSTFKKRPSLSEIKRLWHRRIVTPLMQHIDHIPTLSTNGAILSIPQVSVHSECTLRAYLFNNHIRPYRYIACSKLRGSCYACFNFFRACNSFETREVLPKMSCLRPDSIWLSNASNESDIEFPWVMPLIEDKRASAKISGEMVEILQAEFVVAWNKPN